MNPKQVSLAIEGKVAVYVESFGHVHGVPDAFDLVLDLRDFIKDPHVSPDLRNSTGQALDVRVHVLAAPGAQAMIEHLVGVTLALLESAPSSRPVRLGLACQGGRHRSVAMSEAVAQKIRLKGHGVLVVHHHLTEPVLRAS